MSWVIGVLALLVVAEGALIAVLWRRQRRKGNEALYLAFAMELAEVAADLYEQAAQERRLRLELQGEVEARDLLERAVARGKGEWTGG